MHWEIGSPDEVGGGNEGMGVVIVSIYKIFKE